VLSRWARGAMASPARAANGHARGAASPLRHPRWRARARMEDRRRAAVRSACAEEGLPVEMDADTYASHAWHRPPLQLGGKAASTAQEALQVAIAALEATPAFAPAAAFGGHGSPDNGAASIIRTLTPQFLAALHEAASRHADAGGHQETSADDDPDVEDLAEVVARRLANTAVSRYECDASVDWPLLALHTPGLRASLHLAPSGLVTYTLAPPEDAAGSQLWQMSGEGCWRCLADAAQPTVVVLEMRQGMLGQGPPQETAQLRGPFVLRLDLRNCERIITPGADEDWEDDDEWDEEDDSDCEAGSG